MEIHKPRIDTVSSLYKFHTTADVLRLDLVHPEVSGNKWFKLQGYLEDASGKNIRTIATYGGAYSNHIAATAAAAAEMGFESIGIIRGEEPPQPSHTLREAASRGMKLIFISRQEYAAGIVPDVIKNRKDIYLIREGGYGMLGTKGITQLMEQMDTGSYTDIVAAVGTGTTLAGLIRAARSGQRVTGISVMKNNFSLEQEIRQLLVPDKNIEWNLRHDFHFGGYAKYNSELLTFMNDWYRETGIPTDFVYTARLFYAVESLSRQQYFSASSRVLIIHSGGLQGNRSLPNGTLIF